MASRLRAALDVVPLGAVPPRELRGLLACERRSWAERLGWDPADAVGLTAQAVANNRARNLKAVS